MTMIFKPGTTAPETAIYWCTVCKLPRKIEKGETFPQCENMCGKGNWEKAEPSPKA